LSGLVLGACDGLALLETGAMGLVLTALSLLLIAWKGPRLLATSGLVTGAGVTWTLLFTRVMLSCASENAAAAGSCDAGDIRLWVAIGGAIALAGLGLSLVAARRSRG
jgi:hypothetical protein